MLEIIRKIFLTGIVTREFKKQDFEKNNIFFRRVANEEDTLEPCAENKKTKKIFEKSLHIRHVDSGSCNGCDFEMNTLTNPVYDIQRFGVDFVASPRHADMLMVTGPVTRNLEEAVKDTISAAASPKIVVAVGDCACNGGIFGANYAGCAGVQETAPVFMRIPGCPPKPQTMIAGICAAMKHEF
jgi:Ni,Fe-hydrogenase III small subunit